MDVPALTPPRSFAVAAIASVVVHAVAIACIASALAPSPSRLSVASALPELVVTMEEVAAVRGDAADGDAASVERSPGPETGRSAAVALPRRDAGNRRAKPAPSIASLTAAEAPFASSTPTDPAPATRASDTAMARERAAAPTPPAGTSGADAAGATPASDAAAVAHATSKGLAPSSATPAPGPPTPVAYRLNPPPVYPETARRDGQQGLAIVEALVSRDGAPVDVSLARSSGYAPLDAAAMAAVWQWRFVPATRGGEAILARIRIPLRFRLTDDEH